MRKVLGQSGKVLAVLQEHCRTGCVRMHNGILHHTFQMLCEGDRIPCVIAAADETGVLIEERELTEI